ncbi:MAG: LysR substrate-binding domain-containing protein [Motiliproteus sp.]
MINAAIWAGLRYFHCAAGHLSFTRAADELSVTTGAVSQQIKQLESRLGCRLFHRTTRQLRLTEEGEQLAQAVAQGYNNIDGALSVLAATQLRGQVRLAAIPSFCLQWLVPRLGEFYRTFPDIDLHIDAQDQLQGLADNRYDLALDYRLPRPDDAAPFLTERLFPVCSPELLASGSPLINPKDLLAYPLLHDCAPWVGAGRDEEWQHWLHSVGITSAGDQGQGQVYFNRADLALQAAEAGQGIVLARQALVADRLTSGRLVVACEQRVRSPASYFLQLAPHAQDNTRAVAFQRWLLDLVKAESI